MKWSFGAAVLMLSCSSCITQRAADLLTVPRRAADGEHWERETKLKPQRFEVVASDGIKLTGYQLDPAPGTKRRGTAYLLHGFGNSKEQMLPVAKELSTAGFRCVAWDSRGHGKSEGRRATYGTREVDDALRVIRSSRALSHGKREPEVIWAYSMGSAVALQTMPQLPEVKAAVLLAPMSDLGGVLYHQARRHYRGALTPLVPVVRASVRSDAGFDPKSIRPIDSVKKTRAKLLMIHGERDGTIPLEHSTRLLEACAPGQGKRIVVSDAGHGDVMWGLPEETRDEAIRFLEKNAAR
ncbi:alpha/beta hydrolase [Luteolibacter luteus]|uniref:Alpha/beta hydrolase n=1 Tax=Luteolibacter luteus TaxID=2728835 RepID=A0A858RQ75_9BACT|nr:alpha/beta hydrolase [Luteolibacter luteus]QJE98781.1 alpha/beta hydrolase [Luteolibacter luteus]